VKTECLPFSADSAYFPPFSDYLSYTPTVRNSIPFASVPEWVKEEAQRVRYDDVAGDRSATTRKSESQLWRRTKNFANIERLRRGAQTAVTGNKSVCSAVHYILIFKA